MSDETPNIDAAQERQRALNCERQRRYRQRRNAVAVTQRNAKQRAAEEIAKLSPREARVVTGMLQGVSQSKALADAGFHKQSKTVIDKVRPALKAALVAARIDQDRIAQNIGRRLDATSPMLTTDGCIDRPDWAAQASGCRDAIALLDRAGELPAASDGGHGGGGGVHYHVHLDGLRPQDVVSDGTPQGVLDVSPCND